MLGLTWLFVVLFFSGFLGLLLLLQLLRMISTSLRSLTIMEMSQGIIGEQDSYMNVIFVKVSAPPSQCGAALAGGEVVGSSSASPPSSSCSTAPSSSGSSTSATTFLWRTSWPGRYPWRNTEDLSGSGQVDLYTSLTSLTSTPASPALSLVLALRHMYVSCTRYFISINKVLRNCTLNALEVLLCFLLRLFFETNLVGGSGGLLK